MNIFKHISKRYIIAISAFLVWIIFLDPTSYLIHKELDTEIDKLKNQKEYFQKVIKSDQEKIKVLESDSGLERYAREQYYMKKENESIFIIETDSIKENSHE
jgi:hypothetical protein